ncbi:MAG: Do family serine endopeptidase [Synergistota bacterium]|nr:Do family serine endopeptidase [Synergistota bacterium]
MKVNGHLKTFATLFIVAALCICLHPGESNARDIYTGNPVAEIVEDVSPAVVNIDTETMVTRSMAPFPDDPFFREFFGEQFEQFNRTVPMRGKGSGFIVTDDGYILTNNHVVEGADKITVTLSSGEVHPAEIIGSDPTFDLAVVRIEAEYLPVVELGDSDAVRVGEWVIAIGNPFGFESSVTVGVVSAKNRSVRARNLNFDGFLQTDAAINPGNSGGPLLSLDGRVVGINTAIIPYAQGIGFAVPVNMARQIMDDLLRYGKVKRGWLGVWVQPLTRDFAEAYGLESDEGAVIGDVVPGSPADRAGLRRGDIVVSLAGKPVRDHRDLVVAVRQHLAGDKIEMQIIREGKKMKISANLTTAPGSVPGEESREGEDKDQTGEKQASVTEKLGVSVEAVNQKQRKQDNAPSSGGVSVISVEQGSAASRLGLEPGDILLEVNGSAVKDVKSWETLVSKVKSNIVILVCRDGRTFFVSGRLE